MLNPLPAGAEKDGYEARIAAIKAAYAEVAELDMTDKRIAYVEGATTAVLEHFTGLRTVNLSNTGVTELEGLRGKIITYLLADNLKLNSVDVLAEMISDSAFPVSGDVVWQFNNTTVDRDPENSIRFIANNFAPGTYKAPALKVAKIENMAQVLQNAHEAIVALRAGHENASWDMINAAAAAYKAAEAAVTSYTPDELEAWKTIQKNYENNTRLIINDKLGENETTDNLKYFKLTDVHMPGVNATELNGLQSSTHFNYLNISGNPLTSLDGLDNVGTLGTFIAQGLTLDSIDALSETNPYPKYSVWEFGGSTLSADPYDVLGILAQKHAGKHYTPPTLQVTIPDDAPESVKSAADLKDSIAENYYEDDSINNIPFALLNTAIRTHQEAMKEVSELSDTTLKNQCLTVLNSLKKYYANVLVINGVDVLEEDPQFDTDILEYFPDIISIVLNNTGITEVDGLKNADNLDYVALNNNPALADLSGLAHAKRINTLELTYTGITDKALESLINVSIGSLNISRNSYITNIPEFSSVGSITAHNLMLESVDTLLKMAKKATDLSAITWDFTDSKLPYTAENSAKIAELEKIFNTRGGKFIAPTVDIPEPDDPTPETPKYTVIFETKPSYAKITVMDEQGNVIPGINGVYELEDGSYTYTATSNNFISRSGSFVVNGSALTIRFSLVLNLPPIFSGGNITAPQTKPQETPKYAIALQPVLGGSIAVNTDVSVSDATVYITLTPDEKHSVESITVVDANGNAVTLKVEGEGVYSFKMPAAAVSVSAGFVKTAWVNPFADISEADDYYKAIAYVCENGLFEGVSGDRFAPDSTMTRAMFVTALGRMAGADTVKYSESSFDDVVDGSWYAPYVNWAAEMGIVSGYGNGRFGVDDEITIEQAIVILARYAAYTGIDLSKSTDMSAFLDAADAADWASEQIKWAVGADIYIGEDGMLTPKALLERSLAAEIIFAFVSEYDM